MPNQDPPEEITALAIRSAHELFTPSSLVSRGLREIARGFQKDYPESAEDRALELYVQGKFAEAIDLCTARLKIDSKDEALLQIKGVCLAKQDNVEEGLDCFDQAIAINSGNQYCWLLKSRLLEMRGRTNEQLECLRRVIQIEPSYDGAWKEIGVCLRELGRYEEAVEAFDSGLRQNPSDENCRSQKDIAISELLGSHEDPVYWVVYDSETGWRVMKGDRMEWELESIDSYGREWRRPLQPCFGPFFSNFDPNEGPIGSGRALAEGLAAEKRKLYPNGPIREGQGS
jgi:tetratricopeptide (TPR) repeat protein